MSHRDRSRRSVVRATVLAVLLSPLFAGSLLAAEPHKLALQISDDDPAKMRAVLDVAANVSRHYSGEGQEVDIAVVAFNGGLDMLLADRSPVRERMMR